MNQNEDVSLGAESGDHDNEVIDENTPSATTQDIPDDLPQLYSSSKGGFTCRYYYPVGAPIEHVREFIRAWIRRQHERN
ncbi:hypothetical protein CAEBREN_31827 [Caenorhabditis brenneri]|uniref:Uncharacterized protein n=1 Tax=Caenorhabditis brenneri TaxID=135651 RepID=G0NMU4_CAEBE|nr:hypothetical protein CAEBREN_31827 [Caenorhabditis brenneri]